MMRAGVNATEIKLKYREQLVRNNKILKEASIYARECSAYFGLSDIPPTSLARLAPVVAARHGTGHLRRLVIGVLRVAGHQRVH